MLTGHQPAAGHWTREIRPKSPGTLLLSCGAPAPSKCCGNKKQWPLKHGEGEVQGARGREASAAGVRRSFLCPGCRGLHPSRPPSATGQTKAAHHAPRGRLARRLGPVGELSQPRIPWVHLGTHRAVPPAPLRSLLPGGAACRTSLGKFPGPCLTKVLPAPMLYPPDTLLHGLPVQVASDLWCYRLALPVARPPGHRDLNLRRHLGS